MAKKVGEQKSFVAGIADSDKQGTEYSFAFGKNIDFRSDPQGVTITPKAIKDSGSFVTGLPMWADRAGDYLYVYDDSGKITKKDLDADTWELAHTTTDSSGNGLAYFAEDDNLYFMRDTTFGRLTDADGDSGTFYNNFLESEGGDPTNTASLNLEEADSDYVYVADSAEHSLTGDLSIEAFLKPESYPGSSEEHVVVSKWEEQNNDRSYRMYFAETDDFFGDGHDGALTISSNTTQNPVDANCTGTSGNTYITTSNEHASFSSAASGDKALIHQTRGSNAGYYQLVTVTSYSSSKLYFKEQLSWSPAHSATTTDDNKAQVIIIPQYTNVTVNSGITWTCKAWGGLKGGILVFFASGTTTVNGTIVANGSAGSRSTSTSTGLLASGGTSGAGFWGGRGYRGGSNVDGEDGEGEPGPREQTLSTYTYNGMGGGGVHFNNSDLARAGGGAGHATDGGTGTASLQGRAQGNALLTRLYFGGGGGGGGRGQNTGSGVGGGGQGGGIITIFSSTLTLGSATGARITANGGAGGDGSPYTNSGGQNSTASGGSGAGGSILIKSQTATLGTSKVTASAGSKTYDGGTGSVGRISVNYYNSVSGTTSPSYSSSQDDALGEGEGYSLYFQISDDGELYETFIWNVTEDYETGTWNRWAITFDASLSTAKAYINGSLISSQTRTMTSIDNNASAFAIGADFDGSGAAQNFYDGLIEDVRLWGDIRTASELASKSNQVLYGTEPNLVSYYEFEDDLTDSQTTTANNLTHSSTADYSTDVPFAGVTTRSDEDQSNNQTGNTYTLTTAINEGATHLQTFSPDYDPQKSMAIDITTVGTGDWTITVHDSLNREITSKTITNGELHTSIFEFDWDSVWRPIIGDSYHFHITSTVADGVVVTGTNADLETVRFWTYYQILINTKYHPAVQFLNKMLIGNERYIATFEGGDTYNPNAITLPSGYKVRAITQWREYAAIGVWRGDDITDYDQGYIFFWDGESDTYNYYIPVPEGGINCLFGANDILYAIAGYSGDLIAYNGGGAAQKLKVIPRMNKDEKIEIAPGAMTMWKTLLYFGCALDTDSESVYKGVYSFGSLNRNYPNAFGLDFNTSLGDQTSSDVKIGMIYPTGQSLYVGWQAGNSYGVDEISMSNDYSSNATIELLITDLGAIAREKMPLSLRADFEELEDGEEVTIKFKTDREATWQSETTQDEEGADYVRIDRVGSQAKEIQIAVDLKGTSTTPKLLGVSIFLEGLEEGDVI